MKKFFYVAAMTLMLASCGSDEGKVTFHVPADFPEKTLIVSHINIENSCTAQSIDDVKQYVDTLEIKDGKAVMKLGNHGACRYNVDLPFMTRIQPEFYAMPGENLEVTITSTDPVEYTVSGTPLMDDLTAFLATTRPIQKEYLDYVSSDDSISAEDAKVFMDRYDASIKQFVADHPNSPAIPLAILDLSGDDFKAIYDNMSPAAKNSILMPYAMLYNSQVEEMLKERSAEQDRKAEVASGTITAPNFTLPDLDGKMVSLTDFRGKWVVLDFWGSWCGWCVKGFPALKEAYEKYGDKIVVIGIDCNESEADWRAGVKEHQIPWLNVYNGNNRELYTAYNIEGFPTKAIINPEGKLVDLTTGEDPSFYTRLASFVK